MSKKKSYAVYIGLFIALMLVNGAFLIYYNDFLFLTVSELYALVYGLIKYRKRGIENEKA